MKTRGLKKRISRVAIYLALLVVCLMGGMGEPASALPTDLVPRGSWVYDGLSKLAARRLIPGVSARSLHGDELRTRVDLARLVARLAESAGGEGGIKTEADRALLWRLLEEFKPEYRTLGLDLQELQRGVAPVEAGSEKRPLWIRSGYVMGRALERRDGDEGADLVTRGTVLGLLNPYAFAALTVTDEQEIWSDHPQAYNKLDKAFAFLRTEFANWKLGKDNRYWGPGYGGAMLLSDNAPSFVTLEGQKRFKLPLLGRLLFTQFVGTFEEPGGPRKYVVARRLDRMVGRRLGVALAESYKADTFREGVFALVLPLYLYGNQILDESVHNSERLNYLANIQLTYTASEQVNTYLDFLLDDIKGIIGKDEDVPRKIGFLLGVHLPNTFGSERTDVRVEYALTDGDDPDFPTRLEGGTYLHRNPTLAWFRDGLPIGHRMANNRRGPFVRVRHQITPKLVGIFEWENEEQYRDTPIVGDRERVMLYGGYDFAPDKSVALRVDRLRGALGDDTLWQLQAAYSF